MIMIILMLALAAGAEAVVIETPNSTTVTVAQRIDAQAAAANGGFASITVSGNVTDGGGGGEANRVGAAVPVSMIQQLAASGGAGVVLMVSASKPFATAAEDTFSPGAATDPTDEAAPPTEPSLQVTLAAPPLSVSIAVNGEIVKVRDLKEPILLTVLSKKKGGFECGFFNETTLEWSSEGMWEHDAGNGALVCASTHLTVFAAIKKTWVGLTLAVMSTSQETQTQRSGKACCHSVSIVFLWVFIFFRSAQVTCVPAELLTAEGLLSIPRGSQRQL